MECCSASAAACKSIAPSTPSAGASLPTAKLPVVSVPVLSMMTVSIPAAASSVFVCLIMMPSRAAAANAATIAVGCAINNPPGHVTTRTVIARTAAAPRTASSALLLVKNQTMPATITTMVK